MPFLPTLFIRPGKKEGYYTLRQTGQVGGNQLTSMYLKNLPRSKEAAIKAAQQYANENGIPLDIDYELTKLVDFERGTHTPDPEADELLEGIDEAMIAALADEQASLDRFRDLLSQDLIPSGPYKGQPFSRSQTQWLTYQARRNTEGELRAVLLQNHIIKNHSDKLLPIPGPGFLGTIGGRVDVIATVIKRAVVAVESEWSAGFVITILVTDNGLCLLVKSATWSADVGTRLRLKGTVKDHAVWREQAQTRLQRVVTLEVLP